MNDSKGWAIHLIDRYPRIIRSLILLAVCGISAAVFLAGSAQIGQIGFPLDDAWIHQTYARNLIHYRQWVYFPGQISAGSTSPLWTVLISAAYLFSSNTPFGWTFILGVLSLVGLALAGEQLFRDLAGHVTTQIPWVGIFLATEWHLIWATVSGMETILYTALILAVLVCVIGMRSRYLLAGILAGAACWIRPDGITLLGPSIFLAFLLRKEWKERTKSILSVLGGFAVPFAGYLLFNLSIAGNIWPNTFYAKQAEYAVMINQPLLQRIGNLAALPLIGAGIILIPGFIVACWKAIREKNWKIIALVLWWLGYTLIYAIRLPVTYQHGRYLIPAMPVFFIIGLLGTAEIVKIKYKINKLAWFWGKLTFVSLIGVQLAFGYNGAVAYRQDVAIINSEMVAAAQWLNTNTPQNSIVAAHDIGAIGYFSQRQILDLAGLVSPDVIPFIRNENRLASYLDENHASYLVTFPSWYPLLVSRATPIYQTDASYSIQAGGENMVIYAWRK